MATLEKIRNQAGLLVAVVGIALFAFIIGDFLNSGSTFFKQHQETVLEVNGTSIKYPEYQSRLTEVEHVAELQYGQSNLPEAERVRIRQNVYNSIVEEVLLHDELKKLGMVVTPEEMFDMVQGENIAPMLMQNQMFQNPQTGGFDKSYYLRFLKMTSDEAISNAPANQQEELMQLRSLRLYWEKLLKLQRQEQKYITLLSKAISANKLDAKDAYATQAESSDIAYVMQPYSSVPDSAATVSSSEIEKLYNMRKKAYRQEEAKIISYVSVDIFPSQEDYNKVSAEIEQVKSELDGGQIESMRDFVADNSETLYIDAFRSESFLDSEVRQFVSSAAIGEVYGPFLEQTSSRYRLFKLMDKTLAPDSVKVSHILIANDGREATVSDSLIAELKKGDFAAIAATNSLDQNSAENGGELGWITEEIAVRILNDDFKNAIFSAVPNEVFKFRSTHGTHLLKVTERTSNVDKYKVAEFNKTVSPSTKTSSDLYNALNLFKSRHRDIEQLDTAAQHAGYAFFSDVSLGSNDETVGSIPQSRKIVHWAFEHKKGEISDIFDCDNKHLVFAIMQGTVRKGYRSLSSLEPSLKAELIAKKKGEKIVSDLQSRQLTSLNAYAEAMNASADTVRFINFSTSRISGIGVEPKLNALIAMAPLNTASAPAAGNNGVYVFEVFNRSSSEQPYDEQTQTASLNSTALYRYGYQAMQLLIYNANIKDNRIRFY
ncbi:MAG: SurA N-terminal domain-containing protein [Tannerellaceae bacterium]|jgi:peptidyl-prolyl cis-trans isomerase D|nr:SurA N-terminal domain-containing protein [Tannerellaceae bacterium]